LTLFVASLSVSCIKKPPIDKSYAFIENMQRHQCDTFFAQPPDGAVYPRGFPAPVVSWVRAINESSGAVKSHPWRLTISDHDTVLYSTESKNNFWIPDQAQWDGWAGKDLTFHVSKKDSLALHQALPVTIRIDTATLTEDITFRLLTPEDDFEANVHSAFKTKVIHFDPLSQKATELYDGNQGCMGCHSSRASLNGWTGLLDHAYLLSFFIDDQGRESSFIGPSYIPSLYFPRHSATGDKVIYTVSDLHYGYMAIPSYAQDLTLPFKLLLLKGDVVVHDLKNDVISPLPGADTKDFSETGAIWSPDEKEVAFFRYTLTKKSDIYIVPFNDGKGGKPKPLKGASHNGWNNYFPEYSPDGRWIAFCRGVESTNYAAPSSDIYLVPRSGGRAKKLSCNTDGVMDSWHSWSSDSRWLLFASKRDGFTTRCYLTRIDDQGNSSTPILVPYKAQHNHRINMPTWAKKGTPIAIPKETIASLYEKKIKLKSSTP